MAGNLVLQMSVLAGAINIRATVVFAPAEVN